MEPLFTIATLRRRELEAVATTERLAGELRRTRRPVARPAILQRVAARLRAAGSEPTPCTTC